MNRFRPRFGRSEYHILAVSWHLREYLLLPEAPTNQDCDSHRYCHDPEDPKLVAHHDTVVIATHGKECVHAENARKCRHGQEHHRQDSNTFHLKRVTPCRICDGFHDIGIAFGDFEGVLLHHIV